jgi:hypothetical protein
LSIISMSSYEVHEVGDLERSVCDEDGSARDVNFDGIDWAGVRGVLEVCASTFGKGQVSDLEGSHIDCPYPENLYELAVRGGIGILEDGHEPIAWLRVLVFVESSGEPFVELTFFPRDVQSVEGLRARFVAWLSNISERSRCPRAYVRYENAAWRFGDMGPRSGVFLVLERHSNVA